MKDCKFIILSHYDFTNKEGEQIKGSKVIVSHNGRDLSLSTSDPTVFKLETLNTYYCDLIVNDKLKIDITNIRK